MAGRGPEPEAGRPGDDDLERLRRRVAELEAERREAHAGREHHRLRTIGSTLLVILASVLAMLSVVSVWARDQVTDTDRFVATMAPLARNPQVQDALSARITSVVLQQVDVGSVVDQLSQAGSSVGVPPKAANLITSLSGPIGSGLTSLVGSVVDKVVRSDAFATIWTNAIRAAHTSVEKALTGQGAGAVQIKNNEVTIDIGPAVERVKEQLVGTGFTLASKIPTVHTQFTVFASSGLGKIKRYVRLLQILGNWLPVLAVLIAAAGVYLAANRRRALIGVAVGVATAMLVLGVALAIFRGFFLDQLPADVDSGAAGAVYDALVRFLRITVRMVGTLAVLVGLGAYFSGPSGGATMIRRACSTGIGGVRTVADQAGFRAGPVERFVRRFKHWIGVAILLIAAVVFIAWDHPTGRVVFWFAFVIVIAFGIREFLAPSPGWEKRTDLGPDGRPLAAGPASPGDGG